MPTSDSIKVQQDSVIKLVDGAGTELTVPYVDGAASLDGFNYDQTEPITIYAKRTFLGVRRGAYRPVSFSFTAFMSEFTSATATSLVDFVRFTNAFSANTSTHAASDYKIMRIKFQIAAIGDDATVGEVALDQCILDVSFAEGEPNQFTVSGTCLGGFTVL
tara:strand:+ start:363 stop:845 length:483 start_codon:yes stop_codon:yes gene_type:complete